MKMKKIALTALSLLALSAASIGLTSCIDFHSKALDQINQNIRNKLTYELNEDGASYSVKGGGQLEGAITIPAVHEGKPVTAVADEGFWDCEKITEIQLPDSITQIGYMAFTSCDQLATINFPDSLTFIGESAFSYCESLTDISFPAGITSISYRAFHRCHSLTSVEIPDHITSIGGNAFSDCENLESVTLGKNVKSLGVGAFLSCPKLTSMTLPEGSLVKWNLELALGISVKRQSSKLSPLS